MKDLLNPIYSNLFQLSAFDISSNKFEMLTEQVFSFSIENGTLLLNFEVNETLLTTMFKNIFETRRILIEVHDKTGKVQFTLDNDVIYRKFSGFNGNYHYDDIMKLGIEFKINSTFFTELDNNENKLRLL